MGTQAFWSDREPLNHLPWPRRTDNLLTWRWGSAKCGWWKEQRGSVWLRSSENLFAFRRRWQLSTTWSEGWWDKDLQGCLPRKYLDEVAECRGVGRGNQFLKGKIMSPITKKKENFRKQLWGVVCCYRKVKKNKNGHCTIWPAEERSPGPGERLS